MSKFTKDNFFEGRIKTPQGNFTFSEEIFYVPAGYTMRRNLPPLKRKEFSVTPLEGGGYQLEVGSSIFFLGETPACILFIRGNGWEKRPLELKTVSEGQKIFFNIIPGAMGMEG